MTSCTCTSTYEIHQCTNLLKIGVNMNVFSTLLYIPVFRIRIRSDPYKIPHLDPVPKKLLIRICIQLQIKEYMYHPKNSLLNISIPGLLLKPR